MLAKRGGLAVQRRHRLEGSDATARATRCRVLKQNAKKRADEEARLQDSMGLPAPARVNISHWTDCRGSAYGLGVNLPTNGN